jgi:pimeloyl-ACP methyl ester carboxylesterase
MPTALINGTRLFYELSGAGEIPMVLVHGSWVSHHGWDLVAPKLAQTFRVLTYDRRGHSESEPATGEGTLREDVADLAALIEQQGLAPAWVISNSGGGLVGVRLASERPELFRGLIAHEPPHFSLLLGDPQFAAMFAQFQPLVRALADRVASGDHAGAAQEFAETVIGPGTWKLLPPAFQQTFIRNAPTWLDEVRDPEFAGIAAARPNLTPFDPAPVRRFTAPVLITKGEQSPPHFPPVVDRLARAFPNGEVLTFKGAGHLPQFTHPDDFVRTVTAFIRRHTNSAQTRVA